MKSSLSIWRLLDSVKSTMKISSNFVAFLENINYNLRNFLFSKVAWLLIKTFRSAFRPKSKQRIKRKVDLTALTYFSNIPLFLPRTLKRQDSTP